MERLLASRTNLQVTGDLGQRWKQRSSKMRTVCNARESSSESSFFVNRDEPSSNNLQSWQLDKLEEYAGQGKKSVEVQLPPQICYFPKSDKLAMAAVYLKDRWVQPSCSSSSSSSSSSSFYSSSSSHSYHSSPYPPSPPCPLFNAFEAYWDCPVWLGIRSELLTKICPRYHSIENFSVCW